MPSSRYCGVLMHKAALLMKLTLSPLTMVYISSQVFSMEVIACEFARKSV